MASDELLDSYHHERHPVAQRVIDNVRAQTALMNPDPALDPVRGLFAELMGLEEVGHHLGDMISAQELQYPGCGPGAGTFLPNMTLRTPDGLVTLAELHSTGRPLLVLLAGARREYETVAQPWHDRVATVRATSPYPLCWEAALVRPDGYLAWHHPSGGERDITGLAGALTTWFGPPAA